MDESGIVDLKSHVNFTDVPSIDKCTRNGSRNKDEEIKHLKQQLEDRQRELEIKTLEKAEPELKIQQILLEQDKGYLYAEKNEICLKVETLKSKKTDVEEQIREVKRNLLRTYRK